MKLNPNAVVPTLVHDDCVIIESSIINEYLDDLEPARPMKPEAPYRRARMRLWIKQLDDSIHYAINTVSNAIAFSPVPGETVTRGTRGAARRDSGSGEAGQNEGFWRRTESSLR